MKQALKELIHEMEYVLSCINEDKIPFDGDDFHEALRLGKEALAKPEQKPVAWIVHDRVAPDRLTFVEVKESLQTEVTPLYIIPPQRTWVGIDDEEIRRTAYHHSFKQGVRWAEAKLKEKNT